jgi:hypothetical protein
MATLDGSGRAVPLGMDITLRAPGLRGQATAHNIAQGAPDRGPAVDGASEALDRALTEQGFLRLRVIQLDVAPVPGGGDGDLRAPYSDQPGLELTVPDLGADVAQVLLAVDENGVASWNFPVDSAGAPKPTDRGGGSTVRFIVPAFATDNADGAAPPDRGVLGLLGRKVLELVALPLGQLVLPPLARAAAGAWEAEKRLSRARTFTADNYRSGDVGDLTEDDWKRLAGGRSLWFVHGTFVTSHGAFGYADPAAIAKLGEAYGGRVAALDHHTLGLSPVENVAKLATMVPPGLELEVDIVCHSRGGLVSRALAGEQGTATPFHVRRLVHVATPNHGTALATPDNLVPFIDRITTMTNLAPDGTPVDVVASALSGVLVVVKVIAKYGVTALPGLASMDSAGAFLKGFNTAPVEAEQFAVAADYSPSGGWRAAVRQGTNLLVDRVFGGTANDLVVPTEGVYEGSDAVDIPPDHRLVLPTDRAVYHGSFFNQPDVWSTVTGWLTG